MDLVFVIVIIKYDTTNGKQDRNTYFLLGCERGGGRYKKYTRVRVMSIPKSTLLVLENVIVPSN